jgi:5,10-methenyltetrahydromethanopterin hydrogenase
MDPNATLRELVDALDFPHCTEDAAEHADNLMHWLARGGFYPDLSKLDKQREAILVAALCGLVQSKYGEPNA